LQSLVRTALALIVAIGALYLYDTRHRRIDAAAFSIQNSVTLGREIWKGKVYTASEVGDIMKMVDANTDPFPTLNGCAPLVVLWLGNSQLHFINQAKSGDHLAPYWLRHAVKCPDQTLPLGVSLPNANLQEHLVLEHYITRRLPVRMILLELCFDNMREDGLRVEFKESLKSDERDSLRANRDTKSILETAEAEWQKGGGNDPANSGSGLTGFAQQSLEDRLDTELSSLSPLWNERGTLRNYVLSDLYYLRNYLLGINPSTVRKMIPPRYERNMQALTAILRDAAQEQIEVIGYVAPIRQDRPLPYDGVEYARWKSQLAALFVQNHAQLLNLEKLVPSNLWGTYHEDDVDFMHFQGPGHQIVARALLPYVENAEGASQ